MCVALPGHRRGSSAAPLSAVSLPPPQAEEEGSGSYKLTENNNSAMLRLFKKNKPVKIRSCHENRKYGIAAKDVKELLEKGCKLLQVRWSVLFWFNSWNISSALPSARMWLKKGRNANSVGEQRKDTAVTLESPVTVAISLQRLSS